MTDQILSPKMLGYWTDAQMREVPEDSGVYCVYRAARDPETGEMAVQELLRVGEHRNARHGIRNDETREKWLAFIQPDEALWYAVGLCGPANRERLAAALINAHKPRFNSKSEFLERFPFDETTVHVYGRKDKLQSIFTVQRSV